MDSGCFHRTTFSLAFKRAAVFVLLLALGVSLTIYLVLNGARPPVNPLSGPSWVEWWVKDPRSAASLIVTSALAVFGVIGTYFQIFVSDQVREREKRTLARLQEQETLIKATVVSEGHATSRVVREVGESVLTALKNLETKGELNLARSAGLNDQQILGIAQSFRFANLPIEEWGAELLKAADRLKELEQFLTAPSNDEPDIVATRTAAAVALREGHFDNADFLLAVKVYQATLRTHIRGYPDTLWRGKGANILGGGDSLLG